MLGYVHVCAAVPYELEARIPTRLLHNASPSRQSKPAKSSSIIRSLLLLETPYLLLLQ